MIEMVVGVIGAGVVGSATVRSLVEHVSRVMVHDSDPLKSTHSLSQVVVESDLVFLCVPEGSVEHVMREILYVTRHANLVIKSTVPPGFTRRVSSALDMPNVVHSPEFLTARCANLNAQMPSRIIIGVPIPESANEAKKNMYSLVHLRWPGVPLKIVSSDMSELTKIATNAWFAVKVAWWNELSAACELDVRSYELLRQLVIMDERIHPSHTQVPGPDGKFGFGGACLPKDLQQFIDWVGEDAVVSTAALQRNLKDRGQQT